MSTNQFSRSIYSQLRQKRVNLVTEEEKKWRASVIWKCRCNPLYFIFNYCMIDEGGGTVLYSPKLMHNKIRRVVRSIYNYKKCILMASRQLGKSTIAACLVVWAVIFYPRNKAVILNMKQNAGQRNLRTIKFIIQNLPKWMVSGQPFKTKSEIKTYVELFNDSRIDVFYPATTHDPSTLARSLTVGILYIDEAAFIKYMAEIFGAAQQTLSKAREQNMKYGYPYFMLVTSTPNGSQGDGEWFYNRWTNGVESDDLFVTDPDNPELEIWNPDMDISKAVADPEKNTFVRVRYHWSEDPNKDEQWYREQCQELDDQRKINQELDLLFVGTSACIFDDETLAAFQPINPVSHLPCPHSSKLRLFSDTIDKSDYYIIGADTAQSLAGAFCAVEIFGFRNFTQLGELHAKFGSYTHYGEVIHFVFQWLYKQVGPRIILSIENNTIGQATIEYLLLHVKDFDYLPFFDNDVKLNAKGQAKDLKMNANLGVHEVGIKTTGMTKPLMAGCLVETINENPAGFKSRELVNQFGTIEKTNTGTIRGTSYSDLFMAACFCAYTRKRKAMDIMPKIQFSNQELQSQLLDTVKSAASVTNTKEFIKHRTSIEAEIIAADADYDFSKTTGFEVDDELSAFLPFFSQ